MLKIVIVEPEIFTLLGIKGAISQSPEIEVIGDATCGKIGFQLIEQTNPDVVLVDLLLPDMSGLELTRSIKRKTNSKVVIFTNQTHSDFINSAFRHGADSYMLKSADIELIELAIKRAYFDECLLDPIWLKNCYKAFIKTDISTLVLLTKTCLNLPLSDKYKSCDYWLRV
ncbi:MULTISPECIES: response regulator [Nostoc]|uniref:response regulator n=1 Tax=Nostoc TaxID=1177 RepID=UPI001F558005|nr:MULTISPECIES: response regulator transcription factor [Nostoc]